MSNARMIEQTSDRMTEAEVSLRLAAFLLNLPGSDGSAEVAIDGASVTVGGTPVFDVEGFLSRQSWNQTAREGKNQWTGTYQKDGKKLRVHCGSGSGDVVAVVGPYRIVAECKKGSSTLKKGSPQRPLLTSALGQALLLHMKPNDLAVAAVPDTSEFRKIAEQWRERPLVKKTGIRICLVGQDGNVDGLSDLIF